MSRQRVCLAVAVQRLRQLRHVVAEAHSRSVLAAPWQLNSRHPLPLVLGYWALPPPAPRHDLMAGTLQL